MVEITLPIPWKVSTNSIYAGIHWSRRKKHADTYHCALIPWRGKVKVEKFPVEISYYFTFKGSVLDTSNVAYMAKCLEDSLVIHKIIPNDNAHFVTGTHLYSMKGKSDSVTIKIR